MRGAYLEVMGDLAGSVAVIAAAVVITVTGQTGADAVASGRYSALLILPRTWKLLRDAIDVLLEATPRVYMAHVRAHILDAPGVADVP